MFVDRDWLAAQLESGRSIESLAREVGRHPSTVSYWVRRLGLASSHASRHAPRGAIGRERLEALVAAGLATREIAERLDRSQSTVRHWLKRHGLTTARSNAVTAEPRPREILRACRTHGVTTFRRTGRKGYYRCLLCRTERVAAHRRKLKAILVNEAGGACQLCGYDRCVAALQFHHTDPAAKEFGIAFRGHARGLARARAEVRKCVLLCANCHAEIESGCRDLPLRLRGQIVSGVAEAA